MDKNKPKVISILGPTASGKTGVGVKLAHQLNGEIVSVDSRQVYKGMDIGTGKDLAEYVVDGQKIPYHLIDVVEPTEVFNLSQFKKQAIIAIDDILARGKLPIIVGGTGLYLQALVDNYQLSEVAPNEQKREKLEVLSSDQLFEKIVKLDSELADTLTNDDKMNKRRLIRYIEIIENGGSITGKEESKYDWLIIGLTWPREVLNKRIHQRLVQRLENEDMLGEAERLHKEGVSWQRLESFGLEYRHMAWYLQKKMDYQEMVEKLSIATRQFAKKQMSWYHRWEKQGQEIFWSLEYSDILNKVKKFIEK